MSQTALLIGSDYNGLKGVANDLAAMEVALASRGFTPRLCPPAEATRAGILAQYEKLIADASPGDAIVVYYSGHGGYAAPPEGSAHHPAELQFIVPVDFGQSREDGFRGITSVELSVLQQRLTSVTRNVTVILDCCHSGMMSRTLDFRTKALDGPVPYEWVRGHLDRLAREGLRTDLVRGEGNPLAVRLVACAPQQRAFERRCDDGDYRGVLTESLTLALAEAGAEPVSWASLADRIRHRVTGLMYGQRPEAEGPHHRLLFATEEADLLHSLPVSPLDGEGRVRLDCAPLLRVQHGDQFMVMPAGRPRAERDLRIGELTVESVSALSAEGTVSFAPGHDRVPLGARAFRTTVTAPQIPVKLPVDHPRAGAIRAAIDAAALAGPAADGEADWVGEVRVAAGGGFQLCDRIGPLHRPYRDDPQGMKDLTGAVKILAQTTQLRRLVGEAAYPLDADVTIDWGLVVEGTARPLPLDGAVLAPGQRIYVTVRNEGKAPVYVSLLDIGVSGKVSLVYRATPSGRLLPPGRDLTLGGHEVTQQLSGVELSWPVGLDPAMARPETILVVLTSAPQSLSALEQPEIVQTRAAERGDRASTLRSIIDQLATGATRDIGPDWSTGVRYDIRGIEFTLAPENPSGALVERRTRP